MVVKILKKYDFIYLFIFVVVYTTVPLYTLKQKFKNLLDFSLPKTYF